MNYGIEKLVSPETLAKFRIYENLLRDWNRRIGLVQEETLFEFDTRHVLDSLQLIPIIHDISNDSINYDSSFVMDVGFFDRFIGNGFSLDQPLDTMRDIAIVDVGTGAGFPGMVLAMCGFRNVTLCESNQKKCIFLEEVARMANINVCIINDRVENIKSKYDVIVSRACTDLTCLFDIMRELSRDSLSYGLFHKGSSWKQELKLALIKWNVFVKLYQSISSPNSAILKCNQLTRR